MEMVCHDRAVNIYSQQNKKQYRSVPNKMSSLLISFYLSRCFYLHTTTRWHNKIKQLNFCNIEDLTKKKVYTLQAYLRFWKAFISQPDDGPLSGLKHVAVQ